MLDDVVVDTNVLVHAGARHVVFYSNSVSFVNALLGSNAVLRIDNGFDFDESKNGSIIGHEYLKHLKIGDLGYALLVQLGQNSRIVEASTSVKSRPVRRLIEDIDNKRDRVFVKVAFNSTSRYLVSHDHTDFPDERRRQIKGAIGVSIGVAKEAEQEL